MWFRSRAAGCALLGVTFEIFYKRTCLGNVVSARETWYNSAQEMHVSYILLIYSPPLPGFFDSFGTQSSETCFVISVFGSFFRTIENRLYRLYI